MIIITITTSKHGIGVRFRFRWCELALWPIPMTALLTDHQNLARTTAPDGFVTNPDTEQHTKAAKESMDSLFSARVGRRLHFPPRRGKLVSE